LRASGSSESVTISCRLLPSIAPAPPAPLAQPDSALAATKPSMRAAAKANPFQPVLADFSMGLGTVFENVMLIVLGLGCSGRLV
jgi:hypothetical protein